LVAKPWEVHLMANLQKKKKNFGKKMTVVTRGGKRKRAGVKEGGPMKMWKNSIEGWGKIPLKFRKEKYRANEKERPFQTRTVEKRQSIKKIWNKWEGGRLSKREV